MSPDRWFVEGVWGPRHPKHELVRVVDVKVNEVQPAQILLQSGRLPTLHVSLRHHALLQGQSEAYPGQQKSLCDPLLLTPFSESRMVGAGSPCFVLEGCLDAAVFVVALALDCPSQGVPSRDHRFQDLGHHVGALLRHGGGRLELQLAEKRDVLEVARGVVLMQHLKLEVALSVPLNSGEDYGGPRLATQPFGQC